MNDQEDRGHLSFHRSPSKSGKTYQWEVWNAHQGVYLGEIRWYSQWRRYAFFPESETLFDAVCLATLTGFLTEAMAERA